MKILSILFFFMTNLLGFAQSPMDTLKTKRLDEVVVKGQRGTGVWSSFSRSAVVTLGFNL